MPELSIKKKSTTGQSKLILITLCVVWLLLLQRLGGPSFWTDEMLSFYRASLPNWQSFYMEVSGANHAPLYEWVFLHPWLSLGDGEFWARFPGILLAMLTVSLTYSLGKQTVGGKAGLWGIVFLMFSPLFFQHIREVRPYSLLVFTTTLSIYFWWKAVRSGRNQSWVLFTIFGVATIYTHYYASFVLIGIAITTVLLKFLKKISSHQIYQAGFAYIGIAIIFSPWVPTFLKQLQSGAVSWIPPLSLKLIFELPTSFFAHTLFSDTVWFGISLLVWALFVIAIFLLWKQGENGQRLFVLLSLFFCSFLAVSLASLQKPLLVPRYFVSLTPIVALIAGYVTAWIIAEKKIIQFGLPFILLLVGGYCVFILANLDRTPDWRSGANFIRQMSNPEDTIILFGGQSGGVQLPLAYYLGDSRQFISNHENFENRSAVELIVSEQYPTRRLWLIQSTRSTPSRSLDYQPESVYGPYIFSRRQVFDDRAMKPHLSIDIWLLELKEP